MLSAGAWTNRCGYVIGWPLFHFIYALTFLITFKTDLGPADRRGDGDDQI